MNLNKPAKIIIDDEETEDVRCIVCLGCQTSVLIETEISIGAWRVHAGERLCLGCLSFLFYRGRETATNTSSSSLICVGCGKECNRKYDTEKVLTSNMTNLCSDYKYKFGDVMCETCYSRSRRCKDQLKICVCCGFEKGCRYITEKTVTEKTKVTKPAYVYSSGDALCESCYAKATHKVEMVTAVCACCGDVKKCEYKSKKTLTAMITVTKPNYQYTLGDRMCKTCYRNARLINKN